jgi:hypothetical protein
MRRVSILVSLLAILLVGVIVGAQFGPGATAQEGTPPVDEFGQPKEVTFEGLAFGLAEAMPPGPTGLGLFRVTLDPGANIDLDLESLYFLIFVESGTITFRVDAPVQVSHAVAGTPAAEIVGPDWRAEEEVAADTADTLAQGDDALFLPNPGGTPGEARNDGDEPATVLVVSAGPPE